MSADLGCQELWGVFGGVGPIASLEFLNSIYDATGPGLREQNMPAILLLSDPRVPDRTELLLRGSGSALLGELESGLSRLVGAGATRLVICCVTLHYLVPHLPYSLRAKILSLIDVALDGVAATNLRYLMLCSEGSRKAKLFEGHLLWPVVRERIIMPSPGDQHRIHELIYKIKSGCHLDRENGLLGELFGKYRTDSYIAGCTEIHILARKYKAPASEASVDPLAIIAGMIASCVTANSKTRSVGITSSTV